MLVAIGQPGTSAEKLCHELLVLGSQPLTVLMDSLQCDSSDALKEAGKEAPGGYIYVQGHFYADKRRCE